MSPPLPPLARCDTTNAAGLFYSTTPTVLVAPTPRRVIAGSHRRWHLDHDWLRAWLVGHADPAGTPYVGMRRLLPGQELHVDPNGSVRVVDTIGPTVWAPPDLHGHDAVRALVAAFDVAIAELSAGQSAVACELSGGLDSTFVVASLAQRGDVQVRAFTHIPAPDAVLNPGPLVASDASAAEAVVNAYPHRITWDCVTSGGRGPLEMARTVSGRAWWPAFGPGNLEWLDDIRDHAAAEGYPSVWVGTHGNAAFSYDGDRTPSLPRQLRHQWQHQLRSRLRQAWRSRSTPAAWHGFVTEPPARQAPRDRAYYLSWLAGHESVHAGLMNADAFAVPSVDPFRHRLVLDTAARIAPDAWRSEGWHRGLARSAGVGRVPDSVRLRTERGGQGLDVWHSMFGDHARYREQVDALVDTPAIADMIRIDKVRATVNSWPWGQPSPPPRGEITAVNRLLGFADFVRTTDARLRALRVE